MILATNTFAEDVIYIDFNQKAPYSGYLFSEDKAEENAKKILELGGVKKLNESLEKTVDLYRINSELDQKKLIVLSEHNDTLAIRLREERSMSGWERTLWVGVGLLAAGIGAAALNAATK